MTRKCKSKSVCLRQNTFLGHTQQLKLLGQATKAALSEDSKCPVTSFCASSLSCVFVLLRLRPFDVAPEHQSKSAHCLTGQRGLIFRSNSVYVWARAHGVGVPPAVLLT